MASSILVVTTVSPDRMTAADVDLLAPVIVVPRFADMKRALVGLGQVRTLTLTSGHAVDAVVGALFAMGHDVRALFGIRIAAVGDGTSERLQRHGLRADLVAHGGGADLARELVAAGFAGPVLYPRALEGRPELGDALRTAGLAVEVVHAYETHPDGPSIKAALLRHHEAPYAAVGFTSPRGAAAVLDVFGARLAGCTIGAIGETTRAALVEAGLRDIVVPEVPSVLGLIEVLRDALGS
ncbi:MAG: uroporphyrinogen-III synthase [Polyangia bacterium]